MKGRLHREGLVDEAPVEVLLRLVHHDDGSGLGVELRSAGSTHHLKHVRDGEVHIALQRAIVVLGTLDDHQVRREVDTPRQRRRRDQDQDLALTEELLGDLAVALWEARVMDTDAVGQSLLEARVRDPPHRVLQLVRLQLAELLRVLVRVRRHEGDNVEGREARLTTRGYEDQRRLHAVRLHGMVLDGVEAGLVHLRHTGHEVLLGVALDVSGHRHRPDRRLEVEEADDADAKPIRDVVGVRQRSREADESDLSVQVAGDVAHAGDDDLQHGTSVLTQQMDLVDDDQADLPHIGAVLPMPGDSVPLLGRGDHNVRALQGIHVRREVACQFNHRLAELPLHALAPVLHALPRQRLEWGDVDDLLVRPGVEQLEHGELGHDGLPAAGGRAHEHVVVCVIACVEALRLNGVEVRELVQALEVRVVQGSHRDWRQIEQPRVSLLPIRQEQVVDGELVGELDTHPAVADHADDVLWRPRFLQRNRKGQLAVVLHVLFVQDVVLAVKDVLGLRVLDPDVEGLRGSGPPVAPVEVWLEDQGDPHDRRGNGLDLGLQLQVWHSPHVLLHGRAVLLGAGDACELLQRHRGHPPPVEARVLELFHNLLLQHATLRAIVQAHAPLVAHSRGRVAEVPEHVLALPHAPVNHLAPLQEPVAHLAHVRDARHGHLEQGPEKPRGILQHVVAVADEAERLDVAATEVHLQ
mmetsp:Transcript_115361/g.366862  ORF Transcript_115361/g.366862 Transcript_115361/m.366862 type:complete len:695 (+) Transcript_115361:1573-3657(+)